MEKLLLPQNKFVTTNGLRLHYLDWGSTDATPMVLLHGLTYNAHYWDFFASSVKQDYRILALDQRGHGDSNWAKSYGPRDYVLDLGAFITDLRLENIMLIGHSMGGINAIIYAARHPDQISRLVIIDIGPEIAAAGIERMQGERAGKPEAFDSKEQVTQYIKQIEQRQADNFIRYQAKYAVKYDENDRLIFKYDEALNDTELNSPEWLWEYLQEVICPTLVVHGLESDVLVSEVAQRMVDALAFGSVVDIEHAGHSIPGDNPRGFEVAIRRFLKSDSESARM